MTVFNKEHITRWVSESILIILSVSLAFYFENLRQDRNETKQLISDLKELRNSIEADSNFFDNRRNALVSIDSNYKWALSEIQHKGSAWEIIIGIKNTGFFWQYHNWTLDRILQSESINKISSNLERSLYEYRFLLGQDRETEASNYHENRKRALNTIFSNLKYVNDFEKIPALTIEDQSLFRYRKYSDSSIVYSDEIKSLIIQNMILLRLNMAAATEVVDITNRELTLIDEEIRSLQ